MSGLFGAAGTSAPLPWFRQGQNALHIAATEALARQVAEVLVGQLAAVLARQAQVVVTPSVGQTLQRVYALLREEYAGALDWRRVICVQMDEYAGLPPDDQRSFAYALQRDFVAPLGIGRFLHFHDAAGVPVAPRVYEAQVRALGGIDCAIHGVGRNAHIGFNEPRSTVRMQGGTIRLAAATRAANGVAFTHGVSLGLATFRAARSSLVVLLGSQKRDAAYALLFGAEGPHNPAAQLRHCAQVQVFLDHGAVPASVHDSVAPAAGLAEVLAPPGLAATLAGRPGGAAEHVAHGGAPGTAGFSGLAGQ